MNHEEHLIEVATRTKNCVVCGDEGYLCDDCRESFLTVLEEAKSDYSDKTGRGEIRSDRPK